MKIQKLVLAFVLASFVLVSCKNDAKKTEANPTKKEVATGNTQKLHLNISGMTCEIGCAKTIESKLSKKEGVANAKVIFKDSLAVIEYDATKTNKKDLIAFVDGIAGGKTYKATETDRVAKTCAPDCKKPCCANKDKKACKKGAKCNHKTKEECKKAGCDKKMAASCKGKNTKDCKKGAACDKKGKTACKDGAACKGKDAKDCKKGAACDKKNKTACKPGCKKPCCAKKA